MRREWHGDKQMGAIEYQVGAHTNTHVVLSQEPMKKKNHWVATCAERGGNPTKGTCERLNVEATTLT